MPNAVDQFSSFYAQYRSQGAQAPAPSSTPQPAGNPPAYNPYASGYQPAANRPAPVNPTPWNNPNYPTQTGAAPGYPTQPTQNAQPTVTVYPGQPGYPSGYQGPVTMTLASLKGLVNDKGYNHFVDQTAPVIDTALPLIAQLVGMVSGNKNPTPALGQVPAPPANYPTSTPPYAPAQTTQGQPEWATQVNQGIQGVAGLVNVIGGLFKK